MANKVRFGLSNVYFAKRTESQGVVSYATPVAHEGAISLSLSRNTDKNDFYADNKIFFTSFNKGVKEGTLEVALLKDFVKTEYLGYVADINGNLVETDEAGSSFALLFQVEGDDTNKKYCIYNIKGSEADSEFSTKEDTTTPQTQSIAMSIAGETVGNRQCFIAEVTSFSSVTIPTFASI